jgi:hypothetical protein
MVKLKIFDILMSGIFVVHFFFNLSLMILIETLLREITKEKFCMWISSKLGIGS